MGKKVYSDAGKAYNSEVEFYAAEIAPLVEKIYEKCNYSRVPFFFAAGISDENGNVSVVRQALSATACAKSYPDDEISKHIAVGRGFSINYHSAKTYSFDEAEDSAEDAPEEL